MGYLIIFAIGIYILYAIIKYISSSPERKRLREQAEADAEAAAAKAKVWAEARRAENSMIEDENSMIEEILNGFDINAERQKVIKLLEDNIPDGYRCGKKGCGGILWKQSGNLRVNYGNRGVNYYVCSKCHNIRQTIKA